eukprot:gene8310-1481_t
MPPVAMMRSFWYILPCAMVAGAFTPSADLPPLLQFENGTVVSNLGMWADRRVELRLLLEDHLLGHAPELPALQSAVVINSTIIDGAGEATFYQLTYTTPVRPVSIQVDQLLPCYILTPHLNTDQAKLFSPQGNFFDIVLTHHRWNYCAQCDLKLRMWALHGTARGYCAVVYPGADDREVYGNQFTWTKMRRRAWLASLMVSWVLELPGVDPASICISGHSRNGKQAMIAAAFDDRISAVWGSSPGSPIATPARGTHPGPSATCPNLRPATNCDCDLRPAAPGMPGDACATCHLPPAACDLPVLRLATWVTATRDLPYLNFLVLTPAQDFEWTSPSRDWWLPSTRQYIGREHLFP